MAEASYLDLANNFRFPELKGAVFIGYAPKVYWTRYNSNFLAATMREHGERFGFKASQLEYIYMMDSYNNIYYCIMLNDGRGLCAMEVFPSGGYPKIPTTENAPYITLNRSIIRYA